jgi:hypothetical protein
MTPCVHSRAWQGLAARRTVTRGVGGPAHRPRCLGSLPCLAGRAVAVRPPYVLHHDLPSAPVKLDKKTGEPAGGHAKSWDGGVTELDALDPRILQRLVRDAITSIIDPDALAAAKVAEESDLDTLERIAAAMGGSAT